MFFKDSAFDIEESESSDEDDFINVGTVDIDLSTEVGPTEVTIQALMEYLVGSVLPLKHSDFAKAIPSESQQKSVAKQESILSDGNKIMIVATQI